MKRFFIIILIVTFFLLGKVANAQLSSYFGGKLLFSINCTCNGNYLLYILDYKSMSLKTLVFQQGYSRLYANYNVNSSGVHLLGSYDMFGVCLMEEGPDCDSWKNDGAINNRPGVGTSSF